MKAFPQKEPLMGDEHGMDLRDWFAGMALQGLLSNPKLEKQIIASGGCESGWVEFSAYAFADEMIKVREE
jgi:hypothetical protein